LFLLCLWFFSLRPPSPGFSLVSCLFVMYSVFFVRVIGFVHLISSLSAVFSVYLLRGLSLAFIKPENVMRSPSNMKRTLRTVTVVMETHRDLVCWRRWVSFETAPFCSLTDMANFNCPPEVLTFCDWTLIHGKSPSHFFNFAPG
jgi:hypothetical protein